MLGHRHRAHQRHRPDDAQPCQCVPWAPDAQRFVGAHHGNVAVHGHGHEREDAHKHVDGEDVVYKRTEEGPEHPLRQSVNGGLEGHAEEQEAEVRHAQVQDEDVGRAKRAPPNSSSTSTAASPTCAVPHLPYHY